MYTLRLKLSLLTVKFTHNVCWRITAPFVFPSDVFCFITTLYAFYAFQAFWHVTQFRNAQKHVPRLYVFLIFTSDYKRVIEVNFKGVVQIIYKNMSPRKSFPISLDMKAK